ncbi:hypothetical protein L596_004699 [Steinernema carpocapsae]|uniref:Uncharacterized protein n=1 Tax=Steinernema carpocapsae TaxID=34508 RepID=A0A4U8UXP4_STECR|nr:hypothetical protein L596_004699 [Steinernema carpocapsae]
MIATELVLLFRIFPIGSCFEFLQVFRRTNLHKYSHFGKEVLGRGHWRTEDLAEYPILRQLLLELLVTSSRGLAPNNFGDQFGSLANVKSETSGLLTDS